MTTQDGMLGLVHVVFGDAAAVEEDSRFARRLSEQLGLALGNLKLRETLREQSLNDPLTGLFNRRFLEESIGRELARAARDDRHVAVLMVDADHFKRYNDAHGHEAGDEALRQLGQALKLSCRAADLACRYGGEEFIVVLPGTSREGAHAWAERLHARVRQMRIHLNGKELPGLTVSIGVAIYPAHGDTSQAVLKAADVALYEAKHGGRDRTAIMDEKM
jgi:diguanylate cyclase (GGDEF)-like protein